jgi:hypothetical protein
VSENLAAISGVITELFIHASEEEFIRSASDQVVGVGTAAALAAAGLAGAAAGASLAAASAGDSVEFFECKVGGRLMTGRFSKASLKEGDEVMFIVPQQADDPIYWALAATRKTDHMLWMVPHCSRGVRSHRTLAIRLFVWLLLLTPPLPFLFILFFVAVLGVSPMERDGVAFFGVLCWALGSVVALYYSIRFYRQWLPTARLAERIFAALGHSDPSRVDLPLLHKRYCKTHGIKWPYLTDGPWIYHYLDAH